MSRGIKFGLDKSIDDIIEKELIDLTLVIADVNFWNKIAISFRRLPGRRGCFDSVLPIPQTRNETIAGALWRERCISGGCSFAPRL